DLVEVRILRESMHFAVLTAARVLHAHGRLLLDFPPKRHERSAASRQAGSRYRRSGQQIFVEAAPLHDGRKVPSLVLEEAQIGKRIAVHEKQISDGARLDDPQPTLHADDLRADEGRRAEYFERLHHLGAQQELPRLLVLEL